jgi:acetylornithine deacetylase/succinyl-diaminopimelate desuccinylase-like protein
MPINVDQVLSRLESQEKQQIQELMDWLRIPSISTDPAYRSHCRRAAQWASDHLTASGFTSALRETGTQANPGHPIVLAHAPGDPSYKGPHVLFYGHYDVQPVDPLDLWESPPFEPKLIETGTASGPGPRIVARGAVDDKGQVMMFLSAMRAWKEIGGLAAGGVKMTVLLEGEEESGSVNLDAFLDANKAELSKCTVCLISDTGMLGRGRPAITYGVRGLAYTEVVLHAANQDLHSGLWGGRCPNPISELTKVLAQLWDNDRKVTIPGFYDRVRPITQGERDAWKNLNIDAAESLSKIGLGPEANVGETGYSATEREWARPTAEINGIVGGYTGKGAKTVIPAYASAKVSFRLVADQDPVQVTEAFFHWCKDRTPAGCRWELIDHHGGHPATVRTDSKELSAAVRAIDRATGRKAELIKSGGSIPVAGSLKSKLGVETIFMGFGLEDDRVHSPNEKFELECLRMGTRSHAMFVDELRKL